jgi:hypothetical protein
MQVYGINMNNKKRALLVAAGVLGLSAIGATQVGQLLKIVGIGAVVQKFGPDINKAMNKLATHDDTNTSWTKVVPILSVGSRRAIGAAQVMGPRSKVETVKAVAQLDQDLFGREVKIRAMIPIDSDGLSNIHRVENVGVSGVVDFKVRI